MELELNQVEKTGIFELPKGITTNRVKNVLVNGDKLALDLYTFTENGDLDVHVYREGDHVTILI